MGFLIYNRETAYHSNVFLNSLFLVKEATNSQTTSPMQIGPRNLQGFMELLYSHRLLASEILRSHSLRHYPLLERWPDSGKQS